MKESQQIRISIYLPNKRSKRLWVKFVTLVKLQNKNVWEELEKFFRDYIEKHKHLWNKNGGDNY